MNQITPASWTHYSHSYIRRSKEFKWSDIESEDPRLCLPDMVETTALGGGARLEKTQVGNVFKGAVLPGNPWWCCERYNMWPEGGCLEPVTHCWQVRDSDLDVQRHWDELILPWKVHDGWPLMISYYDRISWVHYQTRVTVHVSSENDPECLSQTCEPKEWSWSECQDGRTGWRTGEVMLC